MPDVSHDFEGSSLIFIFLLDYFYIDRALEQLECLNEIQWSWVQIPLRLTFFSYFKEFSSGEYHMYQVIPLHSCDYLYKVSIKN